MAHPINNLPGLMALAMVQFRSWPDVWKNASNASTFSKPSSEAGLLHRQRLEKALKAEGQKRESRFLKGLERYRHSPYAGPQLTKPTKRLKGNHCHLRFYEAIDRKIAKRKPMILCVPSLVNRFTILDISPASSLVKFYLSQDFDVCVVEWDEPHKNEAARGVGDYVVSLLESLQQHWDEINRPIISMGYCLGGVIATALSCLFPRVEGKILLATPWDFSHYPFAKMDNKQREILLKKIDVNGLFSAEDVQSLCYLANAARVVTQFTRFSDTNSAAEEQNFVAIQHWANDGVDVTQTVARECLVDWPDSNLLMKGEWNIGNHLIHPQDLDVPVFAAIPSQDNIVPYDCAIGLVDQMKNVTLISPTSGHVSMVAGQQQRERLLKPMQRWLQQF